MALSDGMAPSMQTAARLIAHKSINGEYQSLMQLDEMEALGKQMTHSLDTFITYVPVLKMLDCD